MRKVRRAGERGHADHGWLDTYHTFSFADYYDPQNMGFRALRVINEDRVEPGEGFGMHPPRDMEIVTCVLEGVLEHKDSMGNGSVIRPGDVQRMSAGRGVRHSEFNPSAKERVHLLQIWIQPNVMGIEPGYEEKHFDVESRRGQLRLIASRNGENGSVKIHQDAAVYAALVNDGERVSYSLLPGRKAYVHMARGSAAVNGQVVNAGDALKISDEAKVVVDNGKDAEILLFDLI